MRIICDQCQTKYIVPDEKIVKNVLRLTCQKCGHVITTRVEEVTSSDGTLSKWRSTGLKTPKRSKQETPAWYYSYNGESFGPFTQAELSTCFVDGEARRIAEDCYVWHRDLVDWKQAIDVEPFASLIFSPPPPPPPPPSKLVSPAAHAQFPPLLGQSMSSSAHSAVSREQLRAPDSTGLKTLKERLGSTPSRVGEFSASDIAKASRQRRQPIGSEAERFSAASQPLLSDDVPTREKMAAIDWVDDENTWIEDESTSEIGVLDSLDMAAADVGETTRVGAPSPFLSFQSLDVISPDIQAQEASEVSPEALKKPYPTISTLPAVSRSKRAFERGSGAQPKIASLFEASTENATKSQAMAESSRPAMPSLSRGAHGVRRAASEGLRFPELKRASSAVLPPIAKSPAAIEKTSSGAEHDFADHKEDFASIRGPDKPSTAVLQPSAQDDSVSSWLPSQTKLDPLSPSDGISLSDISLDSDLLGLPDASDGLDEDAHQISEYGQIDRADDENSGAISLPTIDLESSHGDLDVVSLSEEWPAIDDSSDFDDSSELEAAASSTLPKSSSIQEYEVSDMNAIFAKDDGVARVRPSRSSLEEIQRKHSSLFDELIQEQNSDETDSSVSENSMLIQLKHLQRVQKKEKRRSTLFIVLVLMTLSLAVGLVVFFGNIVLEAGQREGPQIQGYESVTGRSISQDELDTMAPEDDFAIVEADVKMPKKSRSNKEKQEKTSAKTAKKVQQAKADLTPSKDHYASQAKAEAQADKKTLKPSDEVLLKPPANTKESAMAALYGLPEDSAEPAGLPSRRRADGRSSVVLGKVDNFARTDSVLGSKYANLSQTGSSERDRFTLGLRSVSQTVQECQRREAKTGSLRLPKIYLRIKVEPTGQVNEFEIEEKAVPESFYKCLDSKKDRWKFAPFEGEAIKMRQGFILS